ncbi:MAG: Arm DNA-binding domain-containing protein [Bacillota bacterium]
MRGNIRKRGDTWTIYIYLGRDPANHKKKNYFTKGGFRTKKDAEKALPDLLQRLNLGDSIDESKTTVAEYMDKWMDDYCKQNLAPKSIKRYSDIIRLYINPKLANCPLTKLRPSHILGRTAGRLILIICPGISLPI